jgi:hypothetical protein
MPLKDVASASYGKQKRTFLVFNRKTGDVVSVHHVTAAAGVKLPDDAVLEARVLRTSGAEPTSQELGVIAHEGNVVGGTALRVDVQTRRVISREAEPRSTLRLL